MLLLYGVVPVPRGVEPLSLGHFKGMRRKKFLREKEWEITSAASDPKPPGICPLAPSIYPFPSSDWSAIGPVGLQRQTLNRSRRRRWPRLVTWVQARASLVTESVGWEQHLRPTGMVDSPAGMVNSDVYPSPCAGGMVNSPTGMVDSPAGM
eukprot:1181648-Prorocentrum_minimum.AAC.4